jgi:hypothetical protein
MRQSVKIGLPVAIGVALLSGCDSAVAPSGQALANRSVVAAISTPRLHAIQLFDSLSSPTRFDGHVVVTGAIGDYGTTRAATSTGKPNPKGKYLKFSLHHGTFLWKSTAGTLREGEPTESATNCSFAAHGSYSAVISHGTGQYAGIGGTVQVTLVLAEISPKYTAGSHKGTCHYTTPSKGAAYKSLAAHGKITL